MPQWSIDPGSGTFRGKILPLDHQDAATKKAMQLIDKFELDVVTLQQELQSLELFKIELPSLIGNMFCRI